MGFPELVTAVLTVDFVTIVLSKFFNLGKSLDEWYKRFGIVAVLSDCLIILIGIQLAILLDPKAGFFVILLMAVCIQVVHDILFYLLIIQPIPQGHNEIIDLFKKYANENSWKIIVADSLMVISTVSLAQFLKFVPVHNVTFLGLLSLYALTYIIYTH